MYRIPLLAAALWLAVASAGFAQTTYYVSTFGADEPTRDGRTPATAWASLAYACEQVPGNVAAADTIQVGAGLFVAERAATPAPGTVIEGAGSDATTIRASAAWTMLERPQNAVWQDYLIAFDKFALGYDGQTTAANFTVRDLRLESTLTNLTNGAIYFRDAEDALFERLHVEDFAWSAIHLIACKRVEVRDSHFENANRVEDDFFMGQVYGRVVEELRVHDNAFRNTVPGDRQWGVGYKGRNHFDCQIYDNDFATGDGFDIEVPFEQEWGLEIYGNRFNRTVSVPKGGPNGDPATRGFAYSIWIHDNVFTNGYDIEGPRGYLEVSHNFFDVQNDNGRCIATFGGDLAEPQSIHHNVAVNIDRSFMWANAQQDSVDFYHNTLVFAEADDRAARMVDVRQSARGWTVRNNLFIAPAAQPREVGAAVNQGSTVFEGNLVNEGLDPALPSGNYRDQDPGLGATGASPATTLAPLSAVSFVVDRGVPMGLPFEGAAPDIGAYEYPTDVVSARGARALALTVFPNPVADELTFDSETSGAFQLYDAKGALVRRGGVVAGRNTLALGTLARGHYRLVVIGRRGELRWAAVVR